MEHVLAEKGIEGIVHDIDQLAHEEQDELLERVAPLLLTNFEPDLEELESICTCR